ncbi:26167_t:CDS:2, partial [Gigaspora rosea]
ISFEFENKINQKWRLPSLAIINEAINGTNKCSSTIISGVINIDSWIFGSTMITNFNMVFDQTKSLFGIASQVILNMVSMEFIVTLNTMCLTIMYGAKTGNTISAIYRESAVLYVGSNGYFNITNYLAYHSLHYYFATAINNEKDPDDICATILGKNQILWSQTLQLIY